MPRLEANALSILAPGGCPDTSAAPLSPAAPSRCNTNNFRPPHSDFAHSQVRCMRGLDQASVFRVAKTARAEGVSKCPEACALLFVKHQNTHDLVGVHTCSTYYKHRSRVFHLHATVVRGVSRRVCVNGWCGLRDTTFDLKALQMFPPVLIDVTSASPRADWLGEHCALQRVTLCQPHGQFDSIFRETRRLRRRLSRAC